MVQDYSDYSEILILILMFFFNLSVLLNGTIYISLFQKHHFSYILFCSKMMIYYSKIMIRKKFYRKMFNKHEIGD